MFAVPAFRPPLPTPLAFLLAWLLSLSLGLGLCAPATATATPTQPPAKTSTHKTKAQTSKAKTKTAKSSRGKNAAVPGDSYQQRQEALQWADEAAARLDLPATWLRQHIAQARRIPLIEQLVLPSPKPSAKNWAAYRARFIEPRRIEAGLAFWQRHRETLARAFELFAQAERTSDRQQGGLGIAQRPPEQPR